MIEPIVELGLREVLLLLAMVVALVLVCMTLRLKLEQQISIATLGSVVQLMAVGLVIGWVFDQRTRYWGCCS